VRYRITIALGAFLLFQIQPIAAKTILPWFGGSAAVWSTCLLFFQAALLLGYLYAHVTDRALTPRSQARLHVALLAVSVVLLPLVALVDWKPEGAGNPAFRIIALLSATIGLPYVLLSTTGPLLQAWYRQDGSGMKLYRLYALSNAGSLAALVSYPVVVEPFVSKRSQAWIWSLAYVAYAILCATIALGRQWAPPRAESADEEINPFGRRAGPASYVIWIALAAAPSALLVSITSHLSQNVAPVPFLWVVPLSLYLASFIVCFSHERAYWRVVWIPLLVVALAGMAYGLFGAFTPALPATIALFVSGLFVCCMFCHGELARSKPHPRQLTSFYVALAFGGAVGSLFAGLLAPVLFVMNTELPVAMVAVAALAVIVLFRDVLHGGLTRQRLWHLLWILPAAGLVMVLSVYLSRGLAEQSRGARVAVRNFYGTLRVYDQRSNRGQSYRELLHGTINHGAELLDPQRRCEPITYYGPESGIGLYFANAKTAPARVGVMGLGSGSLAGFGRLGDRYTFFEINPLIVDVARREFSFLEGCGATVDVVMGDARLSIEHDSGPPFDLLIMDAFSGDSIPVHLLTKEALALYFRRLKADGVLAIQISNRYLDLRGVLQHLARDLGKDLLLFDTNGNDDLIFGATWCLLAEPGGVLELPELKLAATPIEESNDPRFLWTDDYSSLWKVLKPYSR
jgi:SAM-dependent methyltransferase